ncbi:MAG: hypothetical protein OXR73_27490 [Myxococcales bacterium]|nr:hypothetical protein [Myxococcales bacterium]
MATTFPDLAGTRWRGNAELWVDPLGDQVERSECTLAVEDGSVRYTWSREGKDQQGSVAVRADAAEFEDSWHQPQPMRCRLLEEAWGLFQAEGRYGPEGDWGWRIALCFRVPTSELVLQMTNIAPWGEEARAVRMVCQRV